ncbi:MAG TPA: DUF6174 domain-containing protein [Gemmatimonadaceae bacterium]|nr:DUF6174 domain-containing protein [Gemmatimonadaceae bacterium]
MSGTWSKRWARRAAVGALVVVSGCGTDPTAPIPLTLRIADAQRRWDRANLSHYRFYSSAGCECLPEYASRKEVFVLNDAVISVQDAATGIPRPLAYRQPIDSLFALLRREVWGEGTVEVEFDSRLGYPRRIAFGRREVDGGGIITVEELEETEIAIAWQQRQANP